MAGWEVFTVVRFVSHNILKTDEFQVAFRMLLVPVASILNLVGNLPVKATYACTVT
jgi:hypothetical protein